MRIINSLLSPIIFFLRSTIFPKKTKGDEKTKEEAKKTSPTETIITTDKSADLTEKEKRKIDLYKEVLSTDYQSDYSKNLEKIGLGHLLSSEIEKKQKDKQLEKKAKKQRFNTINEFIEKKNRLTPLSKEKKFKKKKGTKKEKGLNPPLVTETLAEIYFSQGKRKKAKKAYQILVLKYPEKSSYFTAKLKAIKKK